LKNSPAKNQSADEKPVIQSPPVSAINNPPPAPPKSSAAASEIAEPAVSTSAIKAAANSLHHFDAPPASGAPKELEDLLHGKPNQKLILGLKKEFFIVLSICIVVFVVVYLMVGPGYTH
jgi:hypothetical protein